MKSVFWVALVVAALFLAACDDPDEELASDDSVPPSASVLETPTPSSVVDTSPTPTPLPTTPVETPIKATPVPPQPGWESFENQEFGYTLIFPADWSLMGLDDEATTASQIQLTNFDAQATVGGPGFLPPEKLKLEIVVLRNEALLPLTDWVNQYRESALCETKTHERSDYSREGAPGLREVIEFVCPEVGGQSPRFITWFLQNRADVILVSGARLDSPLLEEVETVVESVTLQ